MNSLILFYFWITLCLSLSYLYIMGRYVYYWKQLPFVKLPDDFHSKTFISVIISVRNESSNIRKCLESILEQNYNTMLFEVIVINDHSTDDTFNILSEMTFPNLKVLQLSDYINASEINAFKKKAIEIGISESKGDLILTTDGDCIVPENWLNYFAYLYETRKVKLIAAPVNFHKEQSLLEYFQSLDFIGMMGITGAGIQGQFMNMCNGANLAYDRKTYFEVEGFKGINHLASGDDMLLMQKIAKIYPNEIAYLKNPKATVLTTAQPTWNTFFQQRIRWASKSSEYKEIQVTFQLGLVWLFCLSILSSLLIWPFYGKVLGWILLGQLITKLSIDFILLKSTTAFFSRSDLMRFFIPSQVLHLLYIVVVGTMSIFIKRYSWKGRSTK